MTTKQAEKLILIEPELNSLAKQQSEDGTIPQINQLIQDFCQQDAQPSRPGPEYSKLLFPTPETCEDPDQLLPLQREIYDQILKLKEAEKLNPQQSNEDQQKILQKFPWESLALTKEQKEQVEQLLIEFHDIFAKHRFDVGYNTELKVKLTPENQLPLYVQGPPTSIHLRDELHVELVLMHYYGLITALSQSKYTSPLFAHRKESGKLRILIDLRQC